MTTLMQRPTADEIITWLETNWLGWREPWDNDFIPFQVDHGYPPHVIVEWCGGLLCDAQLKTGGSYGTPLPPKNAANGWYTPTGVSQFIAAGRWTHTPRRGSWVFFDWQAPGLGWDGAGVDHVGIVTGPLARDTDGRPLHDEEGQQLIDITVGYIDTIEGNVDEACGRFRRWVSSGVIRGFGLPYYAPAASSLPEPAPEPDLAPRRFAPFTSTGDTMEIIDLTDPDDVLGGIPRTFGVIGGTLFPILAPQVDPTDIPRRRMSLAIFQSYYARYCWQNRLNLDLTPIK